jgi:endonuclease YncB( thermonuclease family)
MSIEKHKLPIFIPELDDCICTSVYDGDTIHVSATLKQEHCKICRIIPLSNKNKYDWKIRLRGVDTPEMHGPEQEKAVEIREALSQLISGKEVKITNIAYDKYGRILANVHYKDIDISEWLIENKYAKPYFGGKK